jgi:hypothetical protein
MDAPMPRWFLAFVAAVATLAVIGAFLFLGSGATKNTTPMPEPGVRETTK